MDLVCTSCGEPWDIDYVLHEEPEGFTRKGAAIVSCPCCPERKHGKNLTAAERERLKAARELGELAGDDVATATQLTSRTSRGTSDLASARKQAIAR